MSIDSFIQVPPDSTGKKLNTKQHVVGASTVQTQVTHVGDPNNPAHLQYVDVYGQAYTRFAEGSPSLDAFGNLATSSAEMVGAYEYSQGNSADLFQDALAVSGSITHVPQTSHTVLAVTGTAGSSAIRTTNRYHYYQPGIGNFVVFTLAHGDAGKANNVRRWGYGDANNGLFWALEGTQLGVTIRSSTSGAPLNSHVHQADWNIDKLDGTGLSGFSLDITKGNFYFLDFAWLGVGPVRFGVLGPQGKRIVAHIFENPNANLGAYMQTASLPVRIENYNTGITSGTSELKSICTAVYSENSPKYTYWRFADIEQTTPVTVTTNTPILSMGVGAGSRVGVYPEALSVFVTGGNVKISIVDDAILTGATWGITGGGSAVGDISATAMTGGELFKTFYLPAGVTNIPLSDIYEMNDEGYHRLADDTGTYTFSIVATKLDGTAVTVGASLNYKELR
jgi:hypothetical protein